MERGDPVGRDRRRSGGESERRYTSYVESLTMVQLTWDTTGCRGGVLRCLNGRPIEPFRPCPDMVGQPGRQGR